MKSMPVLRFITPLCALLGAGGPAPSESPSLTAPPARLVATLQPDALDAPEPISVQEAARAAALARAMAEGGHGMGHGGHDARGTYVHVDAGREVAPSPAPHHHQHQR